MAITDETLNLTKAVMGGDASLTKAITTATGLVGYDLAAPSKKLYPVLSPLRNRIPRKMAPQGATSSVWRQVSAINAAKTWASVAAGARNSDITYTTADKSQAFKTFGLDGKVQDEAIWQGRNFEDVRALDALAVLQSVMIQEEYLLLGGNVTAIGKPASVTAASGTGGSLSNSTTYDWGVSALTLRGVYQASTGRGAADAPGETDARTGSTATGGAGTALDLTWPAVRGAFAYNVYAGASAGTKYYIATVYTNGYKLQALVGSGNTVNTADQTANALDFDGIYPQISASAGGAYWKDMAFAGFTSDGANGIVEFDDALQSLWDNARSGPSLILMNSQEARNVTKKIGASSTLGYQVYVDSNGDSQRNLTGSVAVTGYVNKFASSLTPGSPNVVPFMVHPYLPAGTVLMLSESVPYPNSEINNVFEVETLAEYADYEFARTDRNYQHGVYANEALKVFAPVTCAVLTGVKNA